MDDNWDSQLCRVKGEVTAKESPGTSLVGAGRGRKKKGVVAKEMKFFTGIDRD